MVDNDYESMNHPVNLNRPQPRSQDTLVPVCYIIVENYNNTANISIYYYNMIYISYYTYTVLHTTDGDRVTTLLIPRVPPKGETI